MKIFIRSSSNSGPEVAQKIGKHLTASIKNAEIAQRRVLDDDLAAQYLTG
ncbi:hypothetical protein [Deinococcus sp. SL84]|nr:hypothetical protein [Deinococcus sp. SL84]MCY1703731.1 hypothetical protein [Deinococcus sp. SL84]